MTTGDGFDGFIKDSRPSLAKALGDRGVQVHIVDVFDGTGHRLDGIPLALKAVPEAVRVKAAADALRFLTGPKCGMSEEYLYGTSDGAAERDLEVKVQLLAQALCEPTTCAPCSTRPSFSRSSRSTLTGSRRGTRSARPRAWRRWTPCSRPWEKGRSPSPD